MEFQEYPKALYKGGIMAMAADEDREDDLREAGHAEWHVDQKRMQDGATVAEAALEPAKPDTSAIDEAKAQLEELEMHLMAKDHELSAKEQELATREAKLAEAEANLAARLASTGAEAGKRADGPATPTEQAAEEKPATKPRSKQAAAQ